MKTFLKNWKGSVEVDGVLYNNNQAIPSDLTLSENSIVLLHTTKKSSSGQICASDDKIYRITVRSYMTKRATPEFDFMKKWNNDVPMPLMTMVGTIEKETPGMYKMKLHGDITGKPIENCMKCGKAIDNPVSQYFGMGPVCGNHNYVNPFATKEELQEALNEYRKRLINITWEGWVIKSAITEMEEI